LKSKLSEKCNRSASSITIIIEGQQKNDNDTISSVVSITNHQDKTTPQNGEKDVITISDSDEDSIMAGEHKHDSPKEEKEKEKEKEKEEAMEVDDNIVTVLALLPPPKRSPSEKQEEEKEKESEEDVMQKKLIEMLSKIRFPPNTVDFIVGST